MSKKQNKSRGGKQSRFGSLQHFVRAMVIEGLGIVLLASLVGYPLLSQQQTHVSCVDCEPSLIDSGLHRLFATIGLLPEAD